MDYSPYAQVAGNLRENGYHAIPIVAQNKMPFIKNWSIYCGEMPSEELHDEWEKTRGLNVGVACGVVVAVDVDTDDKDIIAAVQSAIGAGVCVRRGKKGYVSLFRHPAGDVRITKARWYLNGDVVFELIGWGHQVVVPPSIHPETKEPYVWTSEEGLDAVDIGDLPVLPIDIEQKLSTAFAQLAAENPEKRLSRHRKKDTSKQAPSIWGEAQTRKFGDDADRTNSRALHPNAIDAWMKLLLNDLMPNSHKEFPRTIKNPKPGIWYMDAFWRPTTESKKLEVINGTKPRPTAVGIHPDGIMDHALSEGYTVCNFILRCMAGSDDTKYAEFIRSDSPQVRAIFDMLETCCPPDPLADEKAAVAAAALDAAERRAIERAEQREPEVEPEPEVKDLYADYTPPVFASDAGSQPAPAPEPEPEVEVEAEPEPEVEEINPIAPDERYDDPDDEDDMSLIPIRKTDMSSDTKAAKARPIPKCTKAQYFSPQLVGQEISPFPFVDGELQFSGLFGSLIAHFRNVGDKNSNMGAIASALVAMTHVMGKGYMTKEGGRETRSSLYVAVMGRSGHGKSRNVEALTDLLHRANVDTNSIGGESYKSPAALEQEMEAAQGRLIIFPDEFGHMIAAGRGKGGNLQLAEVRTLMTKLFGLKRYSGSSTVSRGRTEIDRPCLSVMAASTHEQFWEAQSVADAEDGSLARFILFDMDDSYPNKAPHTDYMAKVAADLNELRIASEQFALGQVSEKTNRMASQVAADAGYIVRLSPEAQKYKKKAQRMVEALTNYAIDNRKSEREHLHRSVPAIYGRLIEIAEKIALTLAVAENFYNPEISLQHYQIGMSIAAWSRQYLVHNIERNNPGSEFFQKCQKLMGLVQAKKNGLNEKTARNQMSIFINSTSDLDQIITHLTTSGQLRREVKTQKVKGGIERAFTYLVLDDKEESDEE